MTIIAKDFIMYDLGGEFLVRWPDLYYAFSDAVHAGLVDDTDLPDVSGPSEAAALRVRAWLKKRFLLARWEAQQAADAVPVAPCPTWCHDLHTTERDGEPPSLAYMAQMRSGAFQPWMGSITHRGYLLPVDPADPDRLGMNWYQSQEAGSSVCEPPEVILTWVMGELTFSGPGQMRRMAAALLAGAAKFDAEIRGDV